MEGSSQMLQGLLYQVEPLLNPLLGEDLMAYSALRSFCRGKRCSPCEACQKKEGLFKACYRLKTNRCANEFLSTL
jgi:hypothetical protein